MVHTKRLVDQSEIFSNANVGFESADFCNYRGYLQFLSRVHLQDACGGKLDHSDIVQQSLLQAFAARAQFQGQTEAERLAWLRKILVHQVARATRDLHTQKRDVKRERSMEAAITESSIRLTHFLAGNESTPSQQLVRQENMRTIADAIEQLPEDQRQVVVLRYWKEMSLPEISETLGKSTAAVAGLLHRATKKLRKTLKADHK